jgi:hypothetical protein
MTGSWALANAIPFEQLNDEVWQLETPLIAPEEDMPTVYADAIASTALKSAAGYPVSVVCVGSSQSKSGKSLTSCSQRCLRTLPILPPHRRAQRHPPRRCNALERHPRHRGLLECHLALPARRRHRSAQWRERRLAHLGHLRVGPCVAPLGRPLDSTPFAALEFGTRHPDLSAFVDISYLGTNLVGGAPVTGQQCTVGFENAGFVLGTTSNIFGSAEALGAAAMVPFLTNPAVGAVLANTPDNAVDTARYPSPFQGLNAGAYIESAQTELDLIDGGFANENVPFQAVIVPERRVDVILALDASADTAGNRPNGTGPYNTYRKTQLPGFGFTPFPAFPPPSDVVALGLDRRPAFYGCDDADAPLVIQLPNYAAANNETGTSTFQVQYSDDQVAAFFANGFAVATQPADPDWPSCLACALVDRAVRRDGGTRTTQCEACFVKWCYPSSAPPPPPGPGPSQKAAAGGSARMRRAQRVKREVREPSCRVLLYNALTSSRASWREVADCFRAVVVVSSVLSTLLLHTIFVRCAYSRVRPSTFTASDCGDLDWLCDLSNVSPCLRSHTQSSTGLLRPAHSMLRALTAARLPSRRHRETLVSLLCRLPLPARPYTMTYSKRLGAAGPSRRQRAMKGRGRNLDTAGTAAPSFVIFTIALCLAMCSSSSHDASCSAVPRPPSSTSPSLADPFS